MHDTSKQTVLVSVQQFKAIEIKPKGAITIELEATPDELWSTLLHTFNFETHIFEAGGRRLKAKG